MEKIFFLKTVENVSLNTSYPYSDIGEYINDIIDQIYYNIYLQIKKTKEFVDMLKLILKEEETPPLEIKNYSKSKIEIYQYIVKKTSSSRLSILNEYLVSAVLGGLNINTFSRVFLAHIVKYNTHLEEKFQYDEYVVYSAKQNRFSLADWILKIALEKQLDNFDKIFLNFLNEIIGSLYKANEKLGFVHYDLHLGNILINNDDDIKIIDYDTSRIFTNDMYFCLNYVEYNILPLHNQWYFDIFKLLMHCKSTFNYFISMENRNKLINKKYKDKLDKIIPDNGYIFTESVDNSPKMKEFVKKLENIYTDTKFIFVDETLDKLLSFFISKNEIYSEKYSDNFMFPDKEIINKNLKFEDFMFHYNDIISKLLS